VHKILAAATAAKSGVVCFVWFVVENQTTICHTKGSEEMYS